MFKEVPVSGNSAAVRVAVSGAVAVGPTSTTAPTDSTTAINAGFSDLGFVSDDGVVESYSDDTTDIKAWQGGITVRTVISGSSATLQFTLIETRGKVLSVYHKGASVVATGAGGWKIDVKAATSDPRSWVLDVVDGTKHVRLYVPNGEVTDRGDITYSGSDAISYQVTVTCYPDVNGVLLTKFSDDPNWAYS